MRKLISVLFLIFSAQSQAYILIEPRVGLEMGNFNYSSINNADDGMGGITSTQINYSGKTSGTTLGVKLGYIFDLGIYLGLESQILNGGKLKVGTDSAGNTVEDFTIMRPLTSALIGYYFPQLVQITYGYIFANDFAVSNSTTSFKLKGGSGHHLNLGFAILPYLNLNVEYLLQTYKQFSDPVSSGNIGLPTDQIGTFYGNVTSNSLNFYFSFPIPIEFE